MSSSMASQTAVTNVHNEPVLEALGSGHVISRRFLQPEEIGLADKDADNGDT